MLFISVVKYTKSVPETLNVQILINVFDVSIDWYLKNIYVNVVEFVWNMCFMNSLLFFVLKCIESVNKTRNELINDGTSQSI